MSRLYLIMACLVLLVFVLSALYTKIPTTLKIMDLKGGRTETSFSWPKGTYNSLLVGFTRRTGHDDAWLKGTLTLSRQGTVVFVSPIDLKESIPCDWLEKEGLTGVILKLSDDSGLDSIDAGATCEVSVEVEGDLGGPYSLWMTCLTTIGPTLAANQDLTMCCPEPRLLSELN